MSQDRVLADLLALSKQLREVVVVGASGFVVSCTTTPERGEEIARVAGGLLEVAAGVRAGGGPAVTRVEVLDGMGGVFVVRDGARTVVATTAPDATPGLVVYDLRTVLEHYDAAEPDRPRATAAGEGAARA